MYDATEYDTEQAVEILVIAATSVERTDSSAVDSILDAIFYLRTGRYPFNRKAGK